jgi:rubrerythrin
MGNRKSDTDPVAAQPRHDINIPLWGCKKCGWYIRTVEIREKYKCPFCRRTDSYVLCPESPANPNGTKS